MAATVPDSDRPRCDSALRELWLGNWIVKRFRVLAENQELILKAFQEGTPRPYPWPRSFGEIAFR
jgi:hypothetical protein